MTVEPMQTHPSNDREASASSWLEGRRRSFDEAVFRHQRQIFELAYRMMHDIEKARDITQEAFTQAYRQLDRFQGRSTLYTWIYRIAMNLCLADHRRRRAKSRPSFVSLDAGPGPVGETDRGVVSRECGPAEAVEAEERDDIVRRSVARLKPILRGVSILRDMEGLSYEQIALVLNIPVGTVRSRLHRARCVLRQELTDELGQEP